MISSKQYNQLLTYFSKIKTCLFITNNTEVDEYLAISRLNELRIIHEKYRKECDVYSIYMHLDLTKLNLYKKDIEDTCEAFKIQVVFTREKTLEWNKSIVAYYKYKEQDITDLIAFNNLK